MGAWRILALVLLLVLAGPLGCAGNSSTRSGYPQQADDEQAQIAAFAEHYNLKTLLDEYYKPGANAEARKLTRDKIINGRLVLIDLYYNLFARQFSLVKKDTDTVFDVASISADAVAALIMPAGTKSIMAAISGGIEATKLAIDKNYYYEKTVPILLASMNAHRKESLIPILEGLQKSDAEYPLARAWTDLNWYYFSGTFDGALQNITANAGKTQNAAQQQLKNVRAYNPSAVARERRALINRFIDESNQNTADVEAFVLKEFGEDRLASAWALTASEDQLDAVIAQFRLRTRYNQPAPANPTPEPTPAASPRPSDTSQPVPLPQNEFERTRTLRNAVTSFILTSPDRSDEMNAFIKSSFQTDTPAVTWMMTAPEAQLKSFADHFRITPPQ